jgi:hypothetical protein
MANAAVFLLLLVTPMLSVLPIASLAMTQDFCVADLTMRETPVGYPCKPPASVTADDFHNAGLAAAGPVLDPFQTGLATTFVTHFPGLRLVLMGGAIAHPLIATDLSTVGTAPHLTWRPSCRYWYWPLGLDGTAHVGVSRGCKPLSVSTMAAVAVSSSGW